MLSNIILYMLSNTVYGNADVAVHRMNTVSKLLFPAHVREMHCNSNDGFEREFGVRV